MSVSCCGSVQNGLKKSGPGSIKCLDPTKMSSNKMSWNLQYIPPKIHTAGSGLSECLLIYVI